MILKLYDINNLYLRTINAKELKITETLNLGYKVAQFKLPLAEGIIKEEQKVIIDNYLYIIKEVNINNNNFYDIYCKPYFGTLNNKYLFQLNIANGDLETYLDQLLASTDWTYKINTNVSGLLSFSLNNCIILEALNNIFELFNVEVFYDTLNKIIYIWQPKGSYKTNFIFNEATLTECKVQSHTYDLITRIIPLGKDKITIADVNNGTVYLDNNTYTNEIIPAFYINDTITSSYNLKQIAMNHLNKLSTPYTNYIIKLSSFDINLEIGDTIRIIDTFKDIDDLIRISKIVYYPDQPELSYIEVGQPQILFNNIYKTFNTQYKAFANNLYNQLN